ncbi:hypothetical protein MBLNU230_g7563t1 [Neophaeotheca triangularis]
MAPSYVTSSAGAGDNVAMKRRSISIFSRRGTETPESKAQSDAQAATAPPKQMTNRQRTWLSQRRSFSSGNSKQDKIKGTVLKAVPPASGPTDRMTALEQEMAISPNAEILSAVSEQAPSNDRFSDMFHGTSPLQQTLSLGRNKASPERKTKKHLKDRIGVWVNGIAEWDEGMQEPVRQSLSGGARGIEGRARSADVETSQRADRNSQKPTLSVVIPNSQLQISNPEDRTVLVPMPRGSGEIIMPMIDSMSQGRRVFPGAEEPLCDIEPVLTQKERPSISRASSSTISTGENDDASVYSKRSSATSIVPSPLPSSVVENHVETSDCQTSKDYPIESPALAGVFDESHYFAAAASQESPPIPVSPPRRAAPCLPVRRKPVQTHATRSEWGAAEDFTTATAEMKESKTNVSKNAQQLDLIDKALKRTSPYMPCAPSEPPSPTLSQAEDELSAQLLDSAVGDGSKAFCRSGLTLFDVGIQRSSSVRSVMQPPSLAPAVPKRSRKREWCKPGVATQLAQVAQTPRRRRSDANFIVHPVSDNEASASPAVSPLKKWNSTSKLPNTRRSAANLPELTLEVLQPSSAVAFDDGLVVVEPPCRFRAWIQREDDINGPKSAKAAEGVLLNILSALTSLDDLAATAQINKGMYRVYREHEMDLIRLVSYNASPAAWEFREWCPPERTDLESSKASSQLEHTPLTYMHCHKRDLAVIQRLKYLVVNRCQTFIRRDTAWALSISNHPNAQRFEDALWRIWCFCKIFGCGKDREEDITGQLDWLKGGLLAHQQGCGATVGANYDFDFSSVLLNAPEHFAKGNGEGLTAEQLYDMTELWTCLVALLSGYQECTEQARNAGVFEGNDVPNGDVEKEAHTLEEWTAYLLTLSPAVIVEMAEHSLEDTQKGFTLASSNGWTSWTAPVDSTSYSTFLKEPVARLYEERSASFASRTPSAGEKCRKEAARMRVSSLAAEIRLARQTSAYKRLPLIDMDSERPMSVLSRRDSAQDTSAAGSGATTPLSPSHIPSASVVSPRKISPIGEDRVEGFNRLSLQNFAGLADDTGERAVSAIVGMGFTVRDARDALKITDMGDGLRLDRAVDLLLRGCGRAF